MAVNVGGNIAVRFYGYNLAVSELKDKSTSLAEGHVGLTVKIEVQLPGDPASGRAAYVGPTLHPPKH